MKEDQLGWAKAKQLANKAMKYALPVVEAGLEFKEKPGILSGMKLLLKLKNIKDTHQEDEIGLFENDNWNRITSEALNQFLYLELMKAGAAKIDSPCRMHHWLEYRDQVFGVRFTYADEDSLPSNEGKDVHLYLQVGNQEALVVLQEVFWAAVGGSALLGVNLNGNYELSKYEHLQGYDTDVTRKYCEEIAKFKESGFSRSFLFYGPPGTGKSSSAAQILKILGYRTLVINNSKNLSSQWLRSYIEMLGAEAILVEDLDHLGSSQLNLILDGFQYLTSRGILILSTCNKIANLDDALIRNGRFDECVEINKLPLALIQELIGDSEVAESIAEFPIAAVMEVQRRLKVLGKEETMARMEDLVSRVDRHKKDVYKL